ncbi:hypothetical protein J0H58_20010 [bacterium]|nr:hypothetical protein [bacterium]
MTHPGRTLLACWLAVVLTGTAVGHRHAAAAGHSHGFGWVVVRTCSCPHDPTLHHHHFVLLGVELPPSSDDGDGGDPTPGIHPAAGQVVPPTDDGRVVDPDPGSAPFDPPTLRASAGRTPVVDAARSSHTSCPLVSRARSGVLRS